MKMHKIKLVLILQITLLLFLIACSNGTQTDTEIAKTPSTNLDILVDKSNTEYMLNKIFETSDCAYTIYTSRLLDTYIIANALKLDFESENLMPNPELNKLYAKTEEYFSPYKTHDFIAKLDKYIDFQYRDVNGSAMQPIIMYLLSNVIYGEEVNKVQSYLFSDGQEFVEFINGLNQFYIDTNADTFFEENDVDYLKMTKYLDENIPSIPIENLINTMEGYVSNKNTYFNNQNVHYTSIFTLYRPFLASFYTIQMGNEVYLTSYQSLIGVDKNISNFDITQSTESAIHEFLHMYINPPVYEQIQLIGDLANGKQKIDYAGSMYQDMDWNRIVDENIVRAIETRIYAIEYKDDEKAFNQVLQKEITMGGFSKVEKLLQLLVDYENNRIEYTDIDMYVPQLIRKLFE